MDQNPTDLTSRAGVCLTEGSVVRKLKWIFREQPISDYGIDAHIEVVEESARVSGQLLAVQIKAGPAYLSETAPGGFIFRPAERHVDYWLNHQLSVIVVLVDIEQEICYWEQVSRTTLQRSRTGKGWKLLVPERQRLDLDSARSLRRIASHDDYRGRLMRLQLAKPLIDLLSSGATLRLEVEEWVNKTSGRGSLRLLATHPSGDETTHEWPYIFPGLTPYEELLPRLFPWADLTIDGDFYELHMELDPSEMPSGNSVLYPYRCGAGEVAFWRLTMKLNTIGTSFLVMDRYCANGSDWWALPPMPAGGA